jgi:site-specific recombinase XerD
MPLNLYRRHQKGCEANRPIDSRTSDFEERKKGWQKCGCFIFASGSLGGDYKRKYTGTTDWNVARSIAAGWEAAGSWTASKPQLTPTVGPEGPNGASNQSGITIERAVKAFMAEFAETAAPNTQKKYRLLLQKLQDFAASKGYIMIDQWTPLDVREMRAAWNVSPQTAAKNISTIKAFFEFGLSNEWITRNPARLVKRQRTRVAADSRNQQKLPFSDDDLKRMYDACETQYGKQNVKWDRTIKWKMAAGQLNRYNRKWTGQDLADFISLSVYTGLRISDVATFHASRMQPTGEILLRTTKAGTHVYTWVPEWLQGRIQARAVEIGPLIFGDHKTTDINVITDVWRRKLINLWALCGEWSAKPTPHRFRHTFARILLQRGVSIRDVADLLGNSEAICRKHYAAWIPERQARLTGILQDAFTERPKPKVVQMPIPR